MKVVVNLFVGSIIFFVDVIMIENDILFVIEKFVFSDKEKYFKKSIDDFFVGLVNFFVFLRWEILFVVFIEVKRSLLILCYLWFEFLVNSMIIIDVIIERGMVIVKECFVYEGFYGFEFERFS